MKQQLNKTFGITIHAVDFLNGNKNSGHMNITYKYTILPIPCKISLERESLLYPTTLLCESFKFVFKSLNKFKPILAAILQTSANRKKYLGAHGFSSKQRFHALASVGERGQYLDPSYQHWCKHGDL